VFPANGTDFEMKPAFNSSKVSTTTFDAPKAAGFVKRDDCWTAGASRVTTKAWGKVFGVVTIKVNATRRVKLSKHDLRQRAL
jgi:hypothetical protein